MLNISIVTPDHARERQIADREPFAAAIVESMPVAAFALDARGRVCIWNAACAALTLVSAEEMLGTAEHWRAFHAALRPSLADLVLKGHFSGRGEEDERASAHAEAWCAMPRIGHEHFLTFEAVTIRDANGRVEAVVEFIRDLTSLTRATAAAHALEVIDELTALPYGRSSFDRLAQLAWQSAQAQGWPMSIMTVDVDCFALYNEAYGHERGDVCLKSIAQAIAGQLARAGDTCVRIGGEQFAVILPDTAMGVAGETAEQIRQAVADLQMLHRASSAAPFVSVSVGVASGTALDTGLGQLRADADAALARAKREGRNRCSASRAGVAISVIDAFDDRPTSREALRRRRDLKTGT